VEIFKIIIGKSGIEFSVSHQSWSYQAKVNSIVLYDGPDYEEARAMILDLVGPLVSETSH
jgi:hypothetical protein